jgi:hypothetical protein
MVLRIAKRLQEAKSEENAPAKRDAMPDVQSRMEKGSGRAANKILLRDAKFFLLKRNGVSKTTRKNSGEEIDYVATKIQ